MDSGAPIANPTWLGNIRHFFTDGDIGCMKPRGVDLSSYADVKSHAFNIYLQVQSGNMPLGGPRWSADQVQTLLNWIQQKFPYGTDSAPRMAAFVDATQPARLRRNVAELDPAEWAKVKAAFEGLMARSPDDPNSFYAQAAIHGVPLLYCMHHVQPFASWHRVYLKLFEDALRTVPGCEDVTLPYWDVTQKAPDVLFEAPFASYTVPVALPAPYGPNYTSQRYSAQEIYDNYQQTPALAWSIGQAVIQPNFGQTSAHGFDSFYVQAHDNGHDRAGPTLQDPNVASFDPIFYFFHCNWDRVWLSWQRQANALDLASFTATLDKDDNPVWLQFPLAPWTKTSADTVSMPEIGYDQYIEGQDMTRMKAGNIGAEASFAVADEKVSIRVKGIDRHNIPGTFAVLLQADGETIARQAFFQPPVAKDCPTCSKQRLVDIDFQIDHAAIAGKTMSIAIDVPSLGRDEMGRFPLSQAGNPTINARLLLEER